MIPPYKKVTSSEMAIRGTYFRRIPLKKKKEGKSVNQSAGTDVPSRFADNEGQQSGSDPDDHKNTSGYPPVEIEQAP